MISSALKKYAILIFTLLLSGIAVAQPTGYNFGKQLLVDAAQVAGTTDLTDSTMLVNFTDADLRSTANGGQVESANGFDIIFTLGDCSTLLEHQIEKYVATTGEYIAWVKIPTLQATNNTNILMYYGNSSVSTDPSTTNVWDANHAAVYHMNQDPSGASPQLTDYTANTNDGVANGAMLAGDLVAGQIGDGIDFDGSNDFFDCGADASTNPNGSLTVSAWIFSRAVSGHIINRGGGWDDPGYSLFQLNNAIRIELQRAGEKDIVDNGIAINTWNYVALTYNATSGAIACFINGVQQPNTGTHTGPMGLPVENLNIGRKEQNAFYFNGIIDEGRVIMDDRSANWILTEYNNQNSPNTFYTKSIEYTAVNLCVTLPVELINFSAKPFNNADALITWTTKSEQNNDYFDVQRSINGTDWETISRIEGAGNSSQEIDYEYYDRRLQNPVTYYRLKQVDFDGTTSFSITKSIQINKDVKTLVLFPNPASHNLTVHTKQPSYIRLLDLSGKVIFSSETGNNNLHQIDVSNLSNGLYFIETAEGVEKFVKQ